MKRRIVDAQQNIEEVRSRWVFPHQMAYVSEVHQRLVELSKLIGTDFGDEVHRHVVVGSIAALETYHRGLIASLVNSGDEYKARAAESISEKVLMKDALRGLSGEAVTFGEIFAYMVPFNKVTDLMSILGDLLDCDLKQALADAIDPYDLRSGTASPKRLLDDVEGLLNNLSEVFRLRHIYAHETASTINVDSEECLQLHGAVGRWINASNAVLWATAYKDKPLTQVEMNESVFSEVREARNELAKTMRVALSIARENGRASQLRKNHYDWMTVTKNWINYAYLSRQGTMWPAIGGSDLIRAIRARVEQVNGWNSYFRH